MKAISLLLLISSFLLFSNCRKEENPLIEQSIIGNWRWAKTIDGSGLELTPLSTGNRIYLIFTEEGEFTKVENGEIVQTSTYIIDESIDNQYLIIDDVSSYHIEYTAEGLKVYNMSVNIINRFSTQIYQPQ